MTNVLLGSLNLIVAGIGYYVWFEVRSSRNYRDKHLRLQGDRLDVDLLTELRLRRLTGNRGVVAVSGGLEHAEGHEDQDDLSHALKVRTRSDDGARA